MTHAGLALRAPCMAELQPTVIFCWALVALADGCRLHTQHISADLKRLSDAEHLLQR